MVRRESIRIRIKFPILFFIIAIARLSFAAVCFTSFREIYYSEFKDDKCYLNSWKFINSLQNTGEDISKWNILFVYAVPDVLIPLNSKSTSGQWHFHVVAEKDSIIYDPDYGKEPKPEQKAVYFPKMFFKDTDEWGMRDRYKNIRVRKIPAKDYLKNHTSLSTKATEFEKYVEGPTPYKEVKLEDFLR